LLVEPGEFDDGFDLDLRLALGHADRNREIEAGILVDRLIEDA
jgi:hypothetical protein